MKRSSLENAGRPGPKEKKPLFPKWNYSRLRWHHPATRRDEGKKIEAVEAKERESVFFIKLLLAVSVLYLLWMGIHETAHYASCLFIGGDAYVKSLMPSPSVACEFDFPNGASDAFLYWMGPYLVALIAVTVLAKTRGLYVRLLAYAAFFDVQYNLFITSLLGGRFGDRQNDFLYFLEQTSNLRGASDVFVMVSAGILMLSVLVFYLGYWKDFSDKKNRKAYITAFIFYAIFYEISLLELYLS